MLDRRCKKLMVAEELVVEILNWKPERHIRLPKIENLPPDWKVVRIGYDLNYASFAVLIWSEQFEHTQEGVEFPLIDPSLLRTEWSYFIEKPGRVLSEVRPA